MAQRAGTPSRRPFRERPNAAEALALDERLFDRPGAFGFFFDVPDPLIFDPASVVDGVATLSICGPLEHHASPWWCSYEGILEAAMAALAHPDVRALVLCIDSPGGVVAGASECARRLRRMRVSSGKPIYGYANELAASAAYWIGCACDELWLPDTGEVGSVGVILCTVDETAALQEAGIAIRYVTTGARKADMHPGNPITPEVLKVAQGKVDALGRIFFSDVAALRGLKPAYVQALEAATFLGADAVGIGLADGVTGWTDFLDTVRGTTGATVGTTRTAQPMPAQP